MPKTVVLRPLLSTRIVSQILPLCLAYLSFVAFRESLVPATWAVPAITATSALAALLSLRLWQHSVVLAPDRIMVRGVLWNRTIDRGRVESVSEFSWVVWKGPTGRTRLTPLTALWTPAESLSQYHEHAAAGRQRAQMWARKK